ncbi:hypothetical protein VZQ01_36100 [Myxococcus faecalis]|uniref:hypothetical protein n=1 Tax=Myxococcus faecalis TaxID=3115646 RepID=UPI003CEF29B0
MWLLLSDKELVSMYVREFIGREAPMGIAGLLRKLQLLCVGVGIYVKTSLNDLCLTLASSDATGDESDNVVVLVRGGRLSVSYFEAGNRNAVTSRSCSVGELNDIVEAYLLRLILTNASSNSAGVFEGV